MAYMDIPRVHIYIHDSSKDIFYELENLSEIRDRTILKLFEADSSGRGPSGLGPSGLPPITNADEEAAAVQAMQQQQQHNVVRGLKGSWEKESERWIERESIAK